MENLTFAPGLPERCYLISPLTGRIVEVHRGESCFFMPGAPFWYVLGNRNEIFLKYSGVQGRIAEFQSL